MGPCEVMVSVIVLTYNHEKYICQALDSILMQKTNFTYEILVGDDASTDRTPNILQDYQLNYPNIFRLFLRKTNQGPTGNAYPLFFEARGKYIATCEGDDFWCTAEKLQKQVDFLEKNPQYVGCSHPCMIVNEASEIQNYQPLSWECTKEVMSIHDYKGYLLPGQAATIVRRNLYKTKPEIDFSIYYQASRLIGDRTTGLIFLSQGDFYRLRETMSAYRVVTSTSSMTVKNYHANPDWIKNDYQYTKKLMVYADTKLNQDVDFEHYLRKLLLSSVIFWCRKPSQEMFQLIRIIFKDCGSIFTTVKYLSVEILYRSIKKLISRTKKSA